MSGAPSVLIVSSEDWAVVPRLPSYLSRAGAEVAAVSPRESAIASSRFLEKLIETPLGDPDAALDRARDALAAGRRCDWMILGDDLTLGRAVDRRGEAWLAPFLPGRAASAEALISKAAFSAAMRAAGVPMPASVPASSPAEIAAAARALGLPVMIKSDRGFAGNDLHSAATAEELATAAAASKGLMLVEKKIDGRVGGTTVLYGAGKPLWWSSFYKWGTWPAPYGPSCRRLAHEPAGLEPILGKIGAALGLRGLFGVDWIETPSGETFVIELNGRPIPMNEGSVQVRERLPEALRDFLAGAAAVRRPPRDEKSGVFHSLPGSFLLAWSEGRRLTALALLLGLAGRVDAPWYDPGIVPAWFRYAWRKALSRALLGR